MSPRGGNQPLNPQFAAGFFVAWSAIYFAAFLYSLWSMRLAGGALHPEKKGESGELVLGFFALSLALSSGASAVFLLGSGDQKLARAIAIVTGLFAPPTLLYFVWLTDGQRLRRSFVATVFGVFSAIAGLGAAEVLGGPTAARTLESVTRVTFSHGTWGPAVMLGAAAVVGLVVTYVQARLFIQARRGLAAFLGSVALSVALAHDFSMCVGSVGRALILSPFGYAAFTLGLFMSQLASFSSRRDKLVRKTNELSDRSQALSRAFKELRAAQSELVRKEQLAAIGELSAVVAHEVRNPLAVITNAVATLGHSDLAAEDREVLLKILEEETTRLNQLVGDLLHYAKPLAPEPQPVGVRGLVDRATAHLRGRADLSIEVLESTPTGNIGGDPMLLRQAIDNVVNNAVQAMPSGGTLTIELARNGVGTEERIVIGIRDTGEGMDTVVRKRALDPFFTTRPAGTGLGLAIVARVVDAHGGRLAIRSAPGAGTEVTMVLPVAGDSLPTSNRRARLSLSSIPDLPWSTERTSHDRISASPDFPLERPARPEKISSIPPSRQAGSNR